MRRRFAPSVVFPSLVAIAALVALPLTVQAVNGTRRDPSVVATVDLPAVIQQLAQFAEAQSRVENLGAAIRADDKEKKDSLERLRMATEAEGLDEPTLAAAMEEYALARLKYQAWFQFAMEQMDIEKSLLVRDVERAVRREIKALCEISGYDLVLVDDSSEPIEVNPELNVRREVQVQQQMRARRVLYASRTVDITEELILRMNNQYNAGQGSP